MPGYHWCPDGLQRRLLEREARRDLRRLVDRFPDVARELALAPADGPGRGRSGVVVSDREPPDELREAYGRYLGRAGTDPEMTISLSFADVLAAWCRARRPRRIADLGSGFSSWVLRRWAPEHAELVSVDDDPRWLERSRAFVAEEGLREGDFVSWEAFRRRRRRHQLVVWDLGGVRSRAAATSTAADRVAPGGALAFDDAHKHRLWKQARRVARRRVAEGFSLRSLTLDEHGRYAWLGLFGNAGRRW